MTRGVSFERGCRTGLFSVNVCCINTEGSFDGFLGKFLEGLETYQN